MPIYLLSDRELHKKVSDDFGYAPGVYRLHFQSEAGIFTHIQRLLDTDDQGILYIGTSISLPYRISSLKRSISAAYGVDGYTDPGTHQCGKKIVQSPRFREHFPFSGFCLTVEPCELHDDNVGYGEGDHTRLEWEKLSEYFSRFGEFPPLNG